MKRSNIKGSAILCVASIIWGLSFVAQSQSVKYISSFTFNCARSVIGSAVLLLFIFIRDRKAKTPFLPESKPERKSLITGGIICGIILSISTNFQQFGISFYPQGVAAEARCGFITALYVILVPIVSVFSKKRINPTVWIGVFIAAIGIYMLCLSDGIGSIYLGDILVFICAICFTCHILAIDKFGAGIDGVKLSFVQFFITSIICGILAVIFEKIVWSAILEAIVPILYMGIMSSGVAYTLQIIGQKYAEPAVASISMSLESVFAAIGGWLIVGNTLTGKEFLGCGLVFAAIIIAQIPGFEFKLKKAVAPS